MPTRRSKSKTLTKFVEALDSAQTIDDVMGCVRRELHSFSRVKDPILAFVDSRQNLRVVYYRGREVHEAKMQSPWSQSQDIRFNDLNDSRYLANVFGRPFARLLAIPVRSRRRLDEQKMRVGGVLYLEHALKENETKDFLEFIDHRAQVLSLSLDRLFLEEHLKEASLMWERTFDGLQDPVAIFGAGREILRANRSFTDQLTGVDTNYLFQTRIEHHGREYEVHSYPITFGENEKSAAIINHYVDVTAAVRLQKQLVQGEKMAALGQLAGHIAHELNNPLTGIRSLAQLLIPQADEGANLKNDLVEVERAAERCQDIITNLREFSSGDYEQKQTRVDLNEIVNKTLSLLKIMTRRFELILELARPEVPVFVEAQLTQQVLFNLVKNACQAMGESGRLTISTISRGDEAILSVADTGPGIAPELRPKIFDYFFTTKSVDEGTGLGLSMSRNIIEKLHGRIEFDSEVGAGTVFRVILPLAREA